MSKKGIEPLKRFVVLQGGTDFDNLATLVENELGSNGEEVETLFRSPEEAEEFNDLAYEGEGTVVEVEVSFKEVAKKCPCGETITTLEWVAEDGVFCSSKCMMQYREEEDNDD